MSVKDSKLKNSVKGNYEQRKKYYSRVERHYSFGFIIGDYCYLNG